MMTDYRRKTGWSAWDVLCQSILALFLGLALSSCAYSAQKTLLVIGDSLSAGYGLPYGSGWVTLLDKRIKAEKFRVKIINASVSGDTTSGGKSRLPLLLMQHRPSVVIIELGGNDGLRGLPLATVDANLRAIIAFTKKTGAKVLLTGMQIPPNYGPDYAKGFAAMYVKIARDTKSALVPFLLEGVAEKRELFQSDGIHPTAEAQPRIVTNVWRHLQPMLK